MIDKNDLLNAEILKLDNLLHEMDLYSDHINLIDHPAHIISLEYLDAYNYEKITIEPLIFNEYNVIKYIISVESYDLDNNEIQLNDYFYCKEIQISESKLNRIEKAENKKIIKWCESKPITLNAWPEKLITIENTVSNRDCYNNISHTHYYYSKTVTLETRDFNDIQPFLILRDFFNNVKMEVK